MIDSWAIARECRLERGSEIAEVAAPLDVDAQAWRSFGSGEVFDVGHAALGEHRRGPALAKSSDHGAHLGQGARRLFLDDIASIGGSVQVA